MSGVPTLQLGPILISAVRAGLSDSDWRGLRDELLDRAGDPEVRGVVIDVSRMDVLDSFSTRMLRQMAESLRLRGARAVLVGIQPAVAIAMTQLGLTLTGIECALDLGHAQELLAEGPR